MKKRRDLAINPRKGRKKRKAVRIDLKLHKLYELSYFLLCGDTIPYPGLRHTLPVPTVRWVHFLYLKLLVCIPFSTGAMMSVLKKWYLHILGFRYRTCTSLTRVLQRLNSNGVNTVE
jgi:hypothetical protein